MNKAESNKIFINNIINEKIKVPSKYLCKNYQDYILKKLKKNEQKCSQYGYIKKNSIEIFDISLGLIEQSTLQGFVIYNVKYKCLICNPIIGSIITVQINNKNQFGLLSSVKDNGINILEIIIPKKSVNIKSDYDLEKLDINDIVSIKLLGKKFHINDSSISGIGIIIPDTKKVKPFIKLDTKQFESDNKIETMTGGEDEDIIIEEEEEDEEKEEDEKEVGDDEKEEEEEDEDEDEDIDEDIDEDDVEELEEDIFDIDDE
jgi:DNA-directed RNA polymerase subunit E'/Rpb7